MDKIKDIYKPSIRCKNTLLCEHYKKHNHCGNINGKDHCKLSILKEVRINI